MVSYSKEKYFRMKLKWQYCGKNQEDGRWKPSHMYSWEAYKNLAMADI